MLANPPMIEKAEEEERRAEMMQLGSITPSVTDKLMSRGGTHCLDEADNWDEDYLTKVFDKASGTIKKNQQKKDKGWEMVTVNIHTALVMHRRKTFNDPANLDRCIVIRTSKASLRKEPDMARLEPYTELMGRISEILCDWESIPDSGINRAVEKWRVLVHVAMKLGFDDYVEKAEREIDRELKESDVSEEQNVAVFRQVIRHTVSFEGEYLKMSHGYVATKTIREDLASEGVHMSSHAINSLAKELEFRHESRAGESRIYIVRGNENPIEKLKEIAERIGYEDAALKD